MKDKKLTDKSIIFYKLYLVNIIITVIFICIISLICSVFSSRMILKNMISYNEDMLAEKSSTLEGRVQQLDEVVYLILGDENVFNLIMTREKEYERPMALLNIIHHFRNVCNNNSLVEEVKILDLQRGIEITDKAKTNIRDISVYDSYSDENSFVIREDENGKKLEVIKRLEPIHREKVIYVVITVNEEAFMDNLLIGGETEMIKSYLMTKDGEVLSVEGFYPMDSWIREKLQKMEPGTEKAEGKGYQMVLYKNKSQASDLVMAAVQDYSYLSKEAGAVIRNIVVTSILMIAVASVIIYLCSLYLYRPLKQLGRKVAGMQRHSEDVENEYALIEHVVNELRNENEYAFPSVIRDSVARLVMEVFDEERFEHLKRVLHQSMAFPWNILVVMESNSRGSRILAEEAFSDMIDSDERIDGFIAGLTETRTVGIFNTDYDYEGFLAQIEEWKKITEQEENVKITCCVSRSFKNWENLNLVYSETLQMLEKALFKGKSTLICESAPVTEYRNEDYKKEIRNKLTQYVIEGKKEETAETLKALTEDLRNRATDIQYTRFVYFKICSNLIQNVLELGGRVSKKYNEKELFSRIFNAGDLQELEHILEEILADCEKHFERKESLYSPNVEKAIAFIHANYDKDLSLDDVAGSIFLSAGYLSIIFKEETGYTVMEYITYIRMQKAKELVRQTPALKVKEIAERLGYNNVQSFIRYFKKYYGETPMAFRKNEGNFDGKE